METSVGTFEVEDAFSLTGRVLVLIGQLSTGQVNPGNKLLFTNGTYWLIKLVEAVDVRNQHGKIGLLMDRVIASRQELLEGSIIGATALVFAQ